MSDARRKAIVSALRGHHVTFFSVNDLDRTATVNCSCFFHCPPQPSIDEAEERWLEHAAEQVERALDRASESKPAIDYEAYPV